MNLMKRCALARSTHCHKCTSCSAIVNCDDDCAEDDQQTIVMCVDCEARNKKVPPRKNSGYVKGTS